MLDFVSRYSKRNVFSEDIIDTARSNDNMVQYLEEVCRIIASTMPKQFQYLGHEVVDERKAFPSSFIQIYDSITYCVKFNFKVTVGLESVYDCMLIKIPKLINNYYYYINGNRFYPIYQLTEATTFHKNESVVLKTMLSPIVLTRQSTHIVDICGKQYTAYTMKLNMLRHRINFMLFYFATMGFFKGIKFIEGPQDTIFSLVSPDLIDDASEEFTYFQINKAIYLRINSKYINNIDVRSIAACIIELCKKRVKIQEIQDINYWKLTLAKVFVKGANVNRAKPDMIIETFKRLYDNITKDHIEKFEGSAKDIYEAIRWMFINFTKLSRRDNNNIYNKRIRLSEYQIAPIIRNINSKFYRVFNSKKKTLKKYLEILTLPYPYSPNGKRVLKNERYPSEVLIKSIINSNNTKYIDSVNDLDLFNIALRWTINGPTAGGKQKASTLAMSQRAQSPSFIGVISMNTASAGDPCATGTFTPFVRIEDGYFKS